MRRLLGLGVLGACFARLGAFKEVSGKVINSSGQTVADIADLQTFANHNVVCD
ncbi:MAG: hypothetical protein JNL38_20530 [Myxococcales bacterium]|jgi:hypothetical protein|nr:hypothetical protein [Myxococcales bacterium]